MPEYRDPENFDPAGALFGRGKGKPLRTRQQALIDERLPGLRVPVDGHQGDLDPAGLFAPEMRDIRLEIGFGGGEHLLARAKASPDIGFIGCEAFLNGVAKAVAAIETQGIANIRLFDGDARRLLEALSPQRLSHIDLLYPDPWPKTRHHKRRFVSPRTLSEIERLLKPGGTWLLASDIPDYVRWSLEHVRRHNAQGGRLVWQAERARDWLDPPAGWPGTRYEAKALREGRSPAYFLFRKD